MHIYNDWIDAAKAGREGKPRIAAFKASWTYTDARGYIGMRHGIKYCIIGTDYGYLHTIAGDIRTWNSESGARQHLRRHILPNQWPAVLYRKIDLYDGRGRYLCSTNAARDCAEALDNCPGAYKARYD